MKPVPTMRPKKRGSRTVALSAAVILSFAVGGAPCQTIRAESDAGSSQEAFRKSPRVFKDVLVSPFHWKKKDYLALTAVLGTGLVLGFMDEDIQAWSQKHRTPGSNDFFGFVTRMGHGTVLGGFMGGLYATGMIAGNDGLRKTALLSLESFLASSVLNAVLKTVIGRSRPGNGEGSGSFHPFSVRSGSTSLPSGHSSSVWSVATVIADRTDNTIVDVICYGLAALTSFSRIPQNKHWASDVFIGSALGYFTAKKICRLNADSGKPKLSASFDLTGNRQVFTISLSF